MGTWLKSKNHRKSEMKKRNLIEAPGNFSVRDMQDQKAIKEAEKDKPQICFTEGYLLKKDKDCHMFVMSFSNDEIGDQMIVANKNILSIKKVGSKTFYEKDFVYGEWK
jgi:hypothetical protein